MTDAGSDDYLEMVVDIHNRQFQRYSIENSIYHIPVDEEEENRLIQQHDVLDRLFDGRLFFPPLEYPRRILDCGYGQGSWAVLMAQTYHQSEVRAMDIWPADLPEVPDNLELDFGDLNSALPSTYRSNSFDLIHSRCVSPGIKKSRWSSYIRDLVRLLKRGGWVQMVEFYYNIQSDAGRLTENHAMYKWGVTYRTTMEYIDRDPRIGRTLADKLRSAGLHDVHARTFQIPIGPWSRDATQRQIGLMNLTNVDEMLDSHALWPFTTHAGYSAEQVGWLTDEARQEARDPNLRLYIPLYVAWARKR